MKIIKIKGGLGNQLFQYAFAKYVEKISGEVVKIDTTYFDKIEGDKIRIFHLDKFKISLEIASKIEIESMLLIKNKLNPKKLGYKILTLMESYINPKYFKEGKNTICEENIIKYSYFDGYFQDSSYVTKVWGNLMNEIIIKQPNPILKAYFDEIKSQNSVFLGVRRGDYFSSKIALKTYGNLDKDYFAAAINLMKERIINPKFYIFSDDPLWVIDNLSLNDVGINYELISKNVLSDIDEFQLMANCKNAIICNSTFHFWAAWLIPQTDKIIISPNPWFINRNDKVIPEDWISINRNGL